MNGNTASVIVVGYINGQLGQAYAGKGSYLWNIYQNKHLNFNRACEFVSDDIDNAIRAHEQALDIEKMLLVRASVCFCVFVGMFA